MKCGLLLAAWLLAAVASATELNTASELEVAAEAGLKQQQQQAVAFLITEAETGHPIAQVTATLQETAAQAVEEGDQEARNFAAFEASSQQAQRQDAQNVAAAQEDTQAMENQQETAEANQAVLQGQIQEGQAEVDSLEEAGQEAAADRAEAEAIENQTAADANETVAALETATAAMEAAAAEAAAAQGAAGKDNGGKVNGGKVNGGKINDMAMLAQETVGMLLLKPLVIEKVSDEEQAMVLGLASAEKEDDRDSPLTGAPEKKPVYEVKSGKVIDLFKKLMNQIEDEAHAAKLSAMKAKTEYDLAKAARDEAVKVASEAVSEKQKLLGGTESTLTQLKTDLKDTRADLDAYKTSLKDRKTSLKLKTDEYRERSNQRKREQEAIAYAVKILSQVAGVRTSMLQLGSTHHVKQADDRKVKAVRALRVEAEKSHSRGLKLLANEVEAHMTDPGVGKEVDIMLEKQLWKLNDEQLADDKKKHWCDAEKNKTIIAKEFKEDDMSEMTDRMASLTADLDSLTEDINAATSKIEDIKAQMHEDKVERQDARNEAKLTIQDAQKAQEAIAGAISTIQKFYKDAQDRAEAASLLQGRFSLKLRGDPDPGFDGGYVGASAGDESPGQKILTLLENTAADFAKQEADTSAQDASDEASFADTAKDSEKEMATNKAELEIKSQEKNRLLEKFEEVKKSYRLTDRQQAALEKYLEGVNADCNVSSYEERKAARDIEILALNDSRVELQEAFESNATAPKAGALAIEGAATKPSPQTQLRGIKEVPAASQQPSVQPHHPAAPAAPVHNGKDLTAANFVAGELKAATAPKPVEPKSIEVKSMEVKSMEVKSVEVKAVDPKPDAPKPAEPKPAAVARQTAAPGPLAVDGHVVPAHSAPASFLAPVRSAQQQLP